MGRRAARRLAGDRRLWEGTFQFGDWLDPDAPPDDLPADAKTDARHRRDRVPLPLRARRRARGAAARHDDEARRRYAASPSEVRTAFLAEYVTPAGRMIVGRADRVRDGASCSTSLPDATSRQRSAPGSPSSYAAAGYRIGTGFVGTPIILDALTRTGHLDDRAPPAHCRPRTRRGSTR